MGAGLAGALATMTVLTFALAQLFDNNVLDSGEVSALDRPVLAWVAAHRDDEVTVAMQTLTLLADRSCCRHLWGRPCCAGERAAGNQWSS